MINYWDIFLSLHNYSLLSSVTLFKLSENNEQGHVILFVLI